MSLFASTKIKEPTINFNGGLYLGCASDPDVWLNGLDGPTYTDTNNMVCFCELDDYQRNGLTVFRRLYRAVGHFATLKDTLFPELNSAVSTD